MKERWFNYRPICLVCAFLMLGSIFAFYFIENSPLVAVIAIIVAILLLALALYKKKLKYFAIPLTAFIFGVLAFNITIINFNTTVEFKPDNIKARISAVGNLYDSKYIKVEADNCSFDNSIIKDNIYIIIYGTEDELNDIEVGRYISIPGSNLKKNELFYNGMPNAKLISNNIKYTAIVKYTDIEFGAIDKTLTESIREDIKDNLNLSLTKDNAELAYSALFGDKTLLDDEHETAFRLSGVAHLLAVSGLHVGIIVMVLNFLLKPIKNKKWLKFTILSIVLLCYMCLCDFTTSVIRAVIMTLILSLSKILNEEYDIYNSIAIAGIVLFLINPLCIFDVSFLMSFSCVLGIAMLYKPIYIGLTKIKINTKIASSLAMSLATTTALIMIMSFYFNTFNAISIIANVILIPLFTIAFIPIFIVSMLSIIISSITYLLFPINYLLDFITFIAKVLGNSVIANFNTISINYIAIIVYFVLLMIIGRLCSTKRQYKVIISLPTLALLFYCLL